jgi:hypothetical protein
LGAHNIIRPVFYLIERPDDKLEHCTDLPCAGDTMTAMQEPFPADKSTICTRIMVKTLINNEQQLGYQGTWINPFTPEFV